MVYRRTARSDAVRAASRERILSAALELFASKGYDATTMQDVVSRAGTSIGNAYFYFKNKEAVAAALAERTGHALYDRSERLAGAIPMGPARVAAILALNTSSFLAGRVDLARLVAATDHRVSVVDVVGDVAVARWIPVLAASFPDLDPRELPTVAAAIWGASRSLAEKVARGKLDVTPIAAAEFLIRWNLRALGVPTREARSALASARRLLERTARQRPTRRDNAAVPTRAKRLK
jgi:AcrR family transcriptional regulator